MYSENDIVQTIRDLINPDYLRNSQISLRINQSDYNSIIITSEKTPYRDSSVGELLFARIKVKGTAPYISFITKYRKLFEDKNITCTGIKSNPDFIRVNLDVFLPFNGYLDSLREIFNIIFIDTFSFPAFGCCEKYNECSDALRCLHPDMAYSTACQYRANLEHGKIFYGKNKTI